MALSACGGGDAGSGTPSGGSSDAGGGDDKIAVTLITKTSTNPFFIAMQEGAKEAGEENSVAITTAAGKADGDDRRPDQGDRGRHRPRRQGHPDHPSRRRRQPGDREGRDAGLYVIALDTPPNPADTVDITFATDNFKAGELIGKWAAGTLDGKQANIAMLDLFNDKVVSVDYNRDQGFLTGMGIDVKDKTEERRRGQDRQVHRRQGRRLHDRLQRADPGRRGRRQDRDGELPVEEQGHQRGLHDQRAGRRSAPPRRCRLPGSRTPSSSRSTVAAIRASSRSRTAPSAPPRSSTR